MSPQVPVRGTDVRWNSPMVRGYSLEMCVLFLFMFWVPTIEAIANRSFAECDVQTGTVYYDPIGKVCRCNRKLCYSSREHGDADVKEEECVPLDIKCGIGMEPDPTETGCVRCPKGTFKSEEGCEWCRQLSVCRDTEWTVFTGNRTTDTKCSPTKPHGIETTLQYKDLSEFLSTAGANTSIGTTNGNEKDTHAKVEKTHGAMTLSKELLSSDLFYGVFLLCGGIFFAIVVLAGCWVACGKPSVPIMTAEPNDEKCGEKLEPIQTCVYQEEGAMSQSCEPRRSEDVDVTSCKSIMASNYTENINGSRSADGSIPHLTFSLLDDSNDMRKTTCAV